MVVISSIVIATYPVFATQGGGRVQQRDDGKFIFIVAPPEHMGLKVGDEMPEKWGVVSVNTTALELCHQPAAFTEEGEKNE